jgi:lipocalin
MCWSAAIIIVKMVSQIPLLLLACVIAVQGKFFWGACPEVNPVEALNVQKYLGTWY